MRGAFSMKKWLQNLENKLRRFMQGRYGHDELNLMIYILALLLVILSMIRPLRYLYIPGLVLMVLSLFRCYSKNIAARSKERAVFMGAVNSVRRFFNQRKNRWRNRKTYRYLRCKGCKNTLRVPRGKGTIMVTCPKCHREIRIKT